MGGCWEKTKNFISGFLVYDTISVVRIKDKRLAVMHYLCMVAILGYVLIYTVWFNQAYYAVEAPVGTVRINPMAASERPNETWANLSDLLYCRSEYHNESYSQPCKYFDSNIDVFPQAVDSSITIASRISFSTQVPTNPDFNDTDSNWNTTSSDLYFLADIENFTLQIDHTFYAPNLHIQNNAREMKGYIKYSGDEDSKDVKPCLKSEVIGRKGKTDIISVCTLLKAAEVNIDKKSVTGKESIRYSGAIFLVFLDYHNGVNRWFGDNNYYQIHVEMIEKTEYKAIQTVYTKKLDGRTIYNRHGLHFVFLQTGKLVKFDFQVLLLSLVSGMGLLAFSTTIVDFISTKILGNKDVVANLKYKTTPNLTAFTPEELIALATKLRRTQEKELALGQNEDGGDRESAVTLRAPLVDRETEE